MKRRDTGHWMWAEAVNLLEEADRLQRQCFRLGGQAGQPRWEPPVDIYEGDGELLIELALPGVTPDRLHLELSGEQLVVRAERRLPHRPRGAAIRRLEIPYGIFERRVGLPPGPWTVTVQDFAHGCLSLLLSRR
ncbi:MAG TPA: Hsp20/alpha crystallin family protein [Steroidobacteraceae bacterium]